MKKICVVIVLFALGIGAHADDRPTPAPGFVWVSYDAAAFEIQQPVGWKSEQHKSGFTQIVRISPETIGSLGMDTGFTMNYLRCSTVDEWNAGMSKVGALMQAIRESIAEPVDSRIKKSDDMVLMVVEGVRLIPNAPHPDKPYHTRTVVRAFPGKQVIFFYSFGSLASDWEAAWPVGRTMLSPILFDLEK